MATASEPTSHVHFRRVITIADLGYLLTSLLLQCALGLFFGHVYDIRISMATGYLVASGQDPYIPQNLTAVFNNPAFQGMTSIGYPPPWPIILGGIYLAFYATTHSFLLYNLAIKLPIIAANLGLAYLVKNILIEHGISPDKSHKAWLFMLFNPFLLYFTTAWGQFDSLVALLTVFSLMLAYKQRIWPSAVALALAIAFKPTPLPIALAVLAYIWGTPWRRTIVFSFTLVLCLLVFCVLPFVIFRWDASPILHGWNAQFSVSGGMSLTTLYELLTNTYLLPGFWWLLGFVWLPAVAVGALFIPRGELGLVVLIKNSLVLTLIFFLTRTWLSEQNLTLILPMVVIMVVFGELPRVCLTVVWLLPLIFTIFNTSPAQLLFPIMPDVMNKVLEWADTFRSSRLILRMLLVIPWQITGWWIIFHRQAKPELTTV